MLAADQERVLFGPPVFAMIIDWEMGLVLPLVAEKLDEVEVVTERMALSTMTLEVAMALLLEVS